MKVPQNFFTKLENNRPFLKAAFQGFAGSGKTRTAVTLAIGLHKLIASQKPIVIFDTEKGSKAIIKFFKKAGIEVEKKESRSLTDLAKTIDICSEGFADILIIDSITHVWENFLQAYMEAKSKRLRRTVTRLSFQDWAYLKPRWKKEFSDRLVMAPVHIIFTGRAGYTYDHEQDEETGKMTELIKTGLRMKAETETAFEPDFLFNMEIISDVLGDKKTVKRLCTVFKDRWDIIDGKNCLNPTFKFFEPAVKEALDGVYTENKEIVNQDNFDELNSKSANWIKRKDVAIETYKGIIGQLGLGTGKDDKKLMLDITEAFFGVVSGTAMSAMDVEQLEGGVEQLKAFKTAWNMLENPVHTDAYAIIEDLRLSI